MAKTDKSTLLTILEGKLKDAQSTYSRQSVYLVDGQYFLRTLPPNLPSTYGDIARSILLQAVGLCCNGVHLIFDDYPQASLKDCERDRRGFDETHFKITGPEQKRPKDLKKELPRFLATEWQGNAYAGLLGSCILYLDISEEVLKFKAVNGCIEVVC